MSFSMAKFLLRRPSPFTCQISNLFIQAPQFTYVRGNDNTADPFPTPKRWPQKNLMMHFPQSPDEPRRRGVYFYCRPNLKYSPKKMWYICSLLKGLSIDEAFKQLQFVNKKGAVMATEALKEAQEAAIREGIIEFKSNMWIGECFMTRGLVLKGVKKMARRPPGTLRLYHVHLFIALVEGPPPKDFFVPSPMTNKEKLDAYIERLRLRRIDHSI